MKKKLPLLKLFITAAMLLILFSTNKSYSQANVFSNSITGNNITANPFSSGQILDANINSTGISRGSGLSSSGANNRYNASGWTTSNSVSSTDYFGFPITPDAGYHINLNNFVYTGQRSTSGPTGFAFRHSGSSFATNIGSPTSTGTTISLTAAPYQNITSATEFRLYGYNSSASSGTFSVNDFSFSGSVLGTSVTALTGFSACLNTAGTAQSFTVNGTGLIPADAVITVAPSANYEISITSATSGFLDASNATFVASGGSVNQTVWVRLKSNPVTGNYNGEMINVSGGGFSAANGINVTCSGSVIGSSTLSFTSATGTDDQAICINNPITNITYLVGGGGTGASATGLPTGVTGSYNSGSKVFTISGSAAASGAFNYTVTTTALCGNTSLEGTITVTPASTLTLTSGAGSNNQSVCLGEAFNNITYAVGGTGTGANVTGLPSGITSDYNAGVLTISGTSLIAGTFNYTVTTTGPCGNPSLNGTLIINTNSTLDFTSATGTDAQTSCINTAITSITYLVGGGGTGASVTGLPAGLNGSYNPGSKVFTISGSATESGSFNYIITTTGPCVNTSLAGNITVTANATIVLTSAANTAAQSVCINTSIEEITYSIAGTGTGAHVTGLPAGVNGSFNSGIFTITGTVTDAGIFNYTVTAEGPCSNPSLAGTIIVNSLPSAVSITPANATICTGNSQALSGSGSLPDVIYINDNFSGVSVFTAAGSSSGNRSQAFEVETSGTNVNSVATFTNGSGNIFVSTAGNSSTIGSGSATTTLTSGALNINGHTISLLTFKHTYKQGNSGSPFGKVEVSTNNGSSWTTLKTYTTNQGSSTGFVTDNVDLSAYSNTASLRIRFNFDTDILNFFSNNTAWWAIDDVLLNGTPVLLYSWTADTAPAINGLPAGAGTSLESNMNISVNPSLTTTYTLTVTGQASGCSANSTGVVMVNHNSTIDLSSGAGTENQISCINNSIVSITYNVGGDGTGATVSGLPNGVTGNFASGVVTISGIATEAGTFNYVVTTTGPCTNPSLGGILTINTPPTVGEISGPTNGCQYTGAAGVSATYSILSSDPLSSYNWNLPIGSTNISGQGTNSIFFKFPDGFVSGNVDVTVTGTCGSPVFKTISIQNVLPGIPGDISGPTNACPYIGTGEEITYSIEPVEFANSYQWTVPSTITIVSGQGTTNLTVTINPGFDASSNPVTRLLRVKAVSGCGNSDDRFKYLFAQFPITPGPISGPTNICDVIGTSNTVTYTIDKVVAATSYAWTTQAGTTTITHPNGPGINDTIILVTFDAGFTTSPVTVAAVNGCGTSGSIRSLTIRRTSSSTPGLISGPTNVCPNILPDGTAATYSIVPVPGATSYTWTAPVGAQVTHPNGSGENDFIVTVLFPAGFTNGTVSVSSTNGCGTSGVRSLNLSRLNPATPSVLDVIQLQACPNRVYSYTLSSVPLNSTSLEWAIPAAQGAVLENETPTAITVSYPQTAIDGLITVQSLNNCGSSSVRTVTVKLPACPPEEGKSEKGQSNPFVKNMRQQESISLEGIEVKIFPNPSVSNFNVKVLTDSKEIIHARILDLQGRELRKFTLLPFGDISIGSELEAGAYIIEVRQGKLKTAKQVIKF